MRGGGVVAGGNCVEVGERGERVREGAVDTASLACSWALRQLCIGRVHNRFPVCVLKGG